MFTLDLETVLSFLDGAKSIVIMGFDGIALETAHKGNKQGFADVAIELGQIVKNIHEISRQSSMGGFQEMVLHFEQSKVVLRSINNEFFLALLLSKDENIGKSQFALQKILPNLQKNL